MPMNDFQSIKKIMLRVKNQEEESNHKTYQGVHLIYFDRGLIFLQNRFSEYIESVLSCMRSRLKPPENPEDNDVLNHTLKIIATHGWEKTEVSYAKQYVNNSYKEVWWKLYNCADTFKWSNIVTLVELVFAIPLSNGHVECCFSPLKFTKYDRILCLKQDRLDNLLRIYND